MKAAGGARKGHGGSEFPIANLVPRRNSVRDRRRGVAGDRSERLADITD